MSESLKSVGAITMFVDDPKRSKEFYERVFDASAIYEDENSVAFEFEKLLVNLLAERAAPELIEPTPVAGRETGERFQLTIWVEDADAVVEQLRSAGVELRSTVRGGCARPRSPTPTATSGRSPRRSARRRSRGSPRARPRAGCRTHRRAGRPGRGWRSAAPSPARRGSVRPRARRRARVGRRRTS